ncbi:IS1/IS1595 family N-terminal zinc-binding domain-containing protein [Phocoenobacter atlanticus]|uniref:IS1/IS1595 family N-terminal zinc-binding domain-containing protein n=1 Tax=Phocoenobacter atlanticus TaxID=3416742 RepID=UPI003B75C9D4
MTFLNEFKKCEKCSSTNLKKNGKFKGKQKYKCNYCNCQFIYKNKPKIDQIWND